MAFQNETQDNKLNQSETYKEDKVLEILQAVLPDSIIKEQSLYISPLKLEIGVNVPYVNGTLVQIIFKLKHELFQEEIIEAVVGAGATFEESLINGVQIFKESILSSMVCALEDKGGQEIETIFADKKNQFKLYRSEVMVQGKRVSGESKDFWELLGEAISRCIGNKRVYLVKIFAAKTGNAVNCECRINGMIYPALSKELNQLANEWVSSGVIYSERQYFTLVQEEATYLPYQLTKKEVESHTMKALLLYRDCKSQEEYEGLYEKIYEECQSAALATELIMLIPEIFTEIIFSEVNYSDELMLVKENERIHLYKHQLSAYDWIYSVVDRTIRAGYFTKEQVDPIIYRSASLSAINDALNKGSKREDLSVLGVALPVPSEYQVQ